MVLSAASAKNRMRNRQRGPKRRVPHAPTAIGGRATVGRHSRHVERKVFKMRELRFAGKVKVELVPTKDNASDMLTKALDEYTFARHRDTIMNRKISES